MHKRTLLLSGFLILLFALIVLTGCARSQQEPAAPAAETTPLDQDIQTIDQASIEEDTSLDTIDSDLAQVQEDLSA